MYIYIYIYEKITDYADTIGCVYIHRCTEFWLNLSLWISL